MSLFPAMSIDVAPFFRARAASLRSEVKITLPSLAASLTSWSSPPFLKYDVSKPSALSFLARDPSMASAMKAVLARLGAMAGRAYLVVSPDLTDS
jgi:hypothetical protein